MVDQFKFYPKDWQSSQEVFSLTLEERGFYFELIIMAYQSNNCIDINKPLWCRLFNVTETKIDEMLRSLNMSCLIVNTESILTLPSVKKRLNASERGRQKVLKRWEKSDKEVINTIGNSNSNTDSEDSSIRKHKHKHKDISKKEKVFTPPTLNEFMVYAKSNFSNDNEYQKYRQKLILKHKGWEANGWRNDYQNKPIKIWKTTLLNTISAWMK